MRGAIFAAIMVGSCLLPWIDVLGKQVSLFELLRESSPSQILQGMPWQGWVILGGWAVAALVVLLSLIGRQSALTMIVAGSAPWVIIVTTLIDVQGMLADMGVRSTNGDYMSRAIEIAQELFGIGIYVYVAAATALLLAGLAQIFRRRR